ncbi:MAG: hypothetical protein GY842_20160, partial [bacterium]|nr:hypothetical protein [bacterium]
MMTARRPSGRNPADHADAPRRTRSVRLCGAVLVVLAAWLAVPVFFPYLATDALVSLLPGDWMAGASAGAQAAAALGHMLPYLLLGLAVYLHAASPRIHHPTAAGEPPTVETQAKCSRWLAACLVAGAISVSLSLAYFHRFVAEDAYISFRYARNLVEGAGLVYNLGERVEGYTNFLWVLMIAGGMRLGADPVGLSQALGLACFGGSLVAVYRIGMTVLPTFRWALVST